MNNKEEGRSAWGWLWPTCEKLVLALSEISVLPFLSDESFNYEKLETALYYLTECQVRFFFDTSAELGEVSLVRKILEKRSDNCLACPYDATAIEKASSNGHLAVVKLLLESGKVNHLKQNLALIAGAGFGQVAIIKLLLEYGANPASRHNVAIMNAANNGYLNMVFFLLKDPRVSSTLSEEQKNTIQAKWPNQNFW